MSNVLSAKLIPAYRGSVEAWECDQMKHMNVQFYMTKTSAAFSHFQNALGLSPARIREEKKGMRFKAMRIQYKSEMGSGGLMHGFAGVRLVEDNIITGFIHLFDSNKQILSCMYEFTAHYADLESGDFLPLPKDVQEKAKQFEDDHSDQYKPAPMATITLPARPMDHMFETNRSAVDVWECDQFHNMEPRHIIARFSDAASHIMAHVGMTRAMQMERNLGSAALDYYMEFQGPIKIASSLVLKSALLDRKPKNFIFGHHLIDCDTGKIVNNTTVLGCYFDMTARKSVPLPQEYVDIPEEKLLRNQL